MRRPRSVRLPAAALAFALGAAGALAVVPGGAGAIEPGRSFDRLVTGNGFVVASYDVTARRVDTFLEHPYRFAAPRDAPENLCFSADESRDLAFDSYFGVRAGAAGSRIGEWATSWPLSSAGYEPGTGVIRTEQAALPGGPLRVRSWTFAPMELAAPVLVLVTTVENVSDVAMPVSIYGLFNFHLGEAGGGREPSADGEEAAWDEARSTFYEWGPSQGTIAYAALSPTAHRTVSGGPASAYGSLGAGSDLDDLSGTSGPGTDVVPGLQGPELLLQPGESTSMAVGIVWALDEDAAPDVERLRTWAGGRAPEELVAGELAAWEAWHQPPPPGLSAERQRLYLQALAVLRMAQVREEGPGHGQLLASLPPGRGDPGAQWNISWVRDMAYATAALARAGHLQEARDALLFQLQAPRGLHVAELGRPYRLSVTRYFGNGAEESDCNGDGPNIELDGFGLFLWSAGEWLRAGGDVEELGPHWPVIRDEIAELLVAWTDEHGVIRPDSSIWEVHWNGRQRRFTYTSLAAARGLCEAAVLADRLGTAEEAAHFAAAGARIRDAVVARHTSAGGVLAQSHEDLQAGSGYLDAATVEALNFGVVDPRGRIAVRTLEALEALRTPSGRGFMRNDDGGWYDSQEWVFVDLRLVPALRAAGREADAEVLLAWVEAQALSNDGLFAELHDAGTGAYAGSVPMAGFGAGAFVLALGETLPPACGSFAPEPAEGGGGGTGGGDAGAGGSGGGGGGDAPAPESAPGTEGCGCSGTGSGPALLALLALLLRSRR